ncbi:MAG: hypothetical protein ACKOQ3_14685 [Novosphingobium sp.]
MNWGGPDFVIAIIAISTGGWLINNWIRARHGYALEDEWGGKTATAESDATRRLGAENAELRDQLEHYADRIQVLERIVTDKGYGVADQIDALRDRPAIAAPSATATKDAG